MSRAVGLTIPLAALVALAPCAARADAGDAALTCPQITSQVAQQNAAIKHAQRIAKLHANEDEGTTASPDVTEANNEASAAQSRAQTLLTLGRSKKCFR